MDYGQFRTVSWTSETHIPSYVWHYPPGESAYATREMLYEISQWREPPIQVLSNTKVSYKTPGYWEKLRKRQKLPDNYFHRSGVIVWNPGSWSASYRIPSTGYLKTWRCSVSPFIKVGILPIGDSIEVCQRAEAQATTVLLSKTNQTKWQAPVFLLEGRKTADMVIDRASQLVHLSRALLRGNILGFLRGLASSPSRRQVNRVVSKFNRDYRLKPFETAGNTWLEFTYGWKPFMYDVYNAMEALFDSVDNEEFRVYVSTGKGRARETVRHSGNSMWDNFNVKESWTEVREVSVKKVWRYQIAPWTLPARFGLDNPYSVAWELLPFSFVADWFLPIGDYLSQFGITNGVSHVGGVTIRYGRSEINDYRISSRESNFTCGTGSFNSSVRGLDRIPLGGAPSLDLSDVIRLSSLDGITEKVTRQISSVALLRQQLSRFRK